MQFHGTFVCASAWLHDVHKDHGITEKKSRLRKCSALLRCCGSMLAALRCNPGLNRILMTFSGNSFQAIFLWKEDLLLLLLRWGRMSPLCMDFTHQSARGELAVLHSIEEATNDTRSTIATPCWGPNLGYDRHQFVAILTTTVWSSLQHWHDQTCEHIWVSGHMHVGVTNNQHHMSVGNSLPSFTSTLSTLACRAQLMMQTWSVLDQAHELLT